MYQVVSNRRQLWPLIMAQYMENILQRVLYHDLGHEWVRPILWVTLPFVPTIPIYFVKIITFLLLTMTLQQGFLVLVAPLKLEKGSGGPARVFAFIPHQGSKASSRSTVVGGKEEKTKMTSTTVSYLKVPPEDWVDLSHGLSETMPLWPSGRPLNFSVIHRGHTPEGRW